jgi:hypothetical protein
MEIQIIIQCPTRFTEVLPEEPENTELAIEECVSQALLELFDTVLVDEVSIHHIPTGQESYGVRYYGA